MGEPASTSRRRRARCVGRTVSGMHERSERFPRRAGDALVVAAVGVAGLFGALGPVMLLGADPARISGVGLVLVVVQAAVLWWRRDRPLAVLAVTVAALLAAQALDDPNVASFFGVHAAAYSVGAYAPRRQALSAVAGLGAAAVVDVGVVAWAQTASLADAVALSPTGMFVVVAWVAGRYVAVRRAYLHTLVAYAHQLERDRDDQARQAVGDERRRIARELHDQVAHHLGVVSLHTQAARRWLDRDHIRTASALQSAERAARSALETMPTILHALRADDAPADLAPQPTLDAIPPLVTAMSTEDVSVDLRMPEGRPRLPPGVELAAYRVVQEALTNVVKHAGPAHVTVEVRVSAERLEVEVTDDGRGLAAAPSDGAGLGLVGMRERVDLLDGQLYTGAREGGGFTVRATLPLTRART